MEHKKTKQTSRDIQAQQTKKRVYESAVVLIREVGYNNVTVDDITKATGVSKGTFYLYFETKDAVLAEVFAALDAHYASIIKKLPDVPIDQQLIYFLNQLSDYCDHVCGLNIMKTLYMHQISTELRMKLLNNKDRPFYTIMNSFVRNGRESGVFRSDISEFEMLDILVRSVHGLIYDWCLYDGEFDLVEECTRYFDHIVGLIRTC